jgi:hypothetical protein
MPTRILHKNGPLYSETRFKDVKDPCPVFDGSIWHIFGSGGTVVTETWKILHATAPGIMGPWSEQEPCNLVGVAGDHVAAPGVVYDEAEKKFHMFVQTDFLATNGTVEHLTSTDGHTFTKEETAIVPIPDTGEAGIYDPHPAVIKGEKYIVYSGTPRVSDVGGGKFVSQPDIYLVKSENGSWNGPWKRLGKILDHEEIAAHHNQRLDVNYEWGIEGPQLIELPNGKVLLNATSFLPDKLFGTRQRTFFAVGDTPMGPFISRGPVIHADLQPWESGENGHSAGVIWNGELVLFYQARSIKETTNVHLNDWRYGIATFDLSNFRVNT